MKTVEIILGFFGFAVAQAPRPTMPGTVDTMSKFREEYGTFVPESIKVLDLKSRNSLNSSSSCSPHSEIT
jgi:hypothetical protein